MGLRIGESARHIQRNSSLVPVGHGMTARDFVSRLEGVSKSANGFEARCPAHKDHRASLSVTDGDKGIVLYCHAGCQPEAIARALGLQMSDLFNGDPKRNGKPSIVATYDYTDESGKALFQVVRFEPKDFRQRRPDGAGGWAWNPKGVRLVPFHLPQLLAAVKGGRPAWIVEGERDVLTMEGQGFAATCNPMGAGKWRAEFSKHLAGADVVIVADKDEPGRKHAQDVAGKLHGTAKTVRVVECPDVGGSHPKDASDDFSAGGDPFSLDLHAESAPLWTPTKTDGPCARPIGSLVAPSTDDGTTLLGRRWLCRGAGALLIGQSGQGKSSLAMQGGILWSIGRSCFGIEPVRPLKILLIQSENDDGDLFETFDGICKGLQLSPEDRAKAGANILLFTEDSLAGDAFIELVAKLVGSYTPDLLWHRAHPIGAVDSRKSK